MKKNPNELRADKAKALAAYDALRQVSLSEDRDPTEEETAKMDEHLATAEARENEAAEIEAQERLTAERDSRAATLRDQGASGPRTQSRNQDIRVISDRQIDEDPFCGFSERGYGDFAHLVRYASLPGNRVDDRLLRMRAAASGQQTGVGEDGGFLIPPGYSNRIYERAVTGLPVLSQCDRIVLTGPGNSLTINGQVDHDKSSTTYRYGGVVVYHVGEADQITSSKLKFRQITLKLNKIAALSYCTEEELSDAFVNFGDRLLMRHADAIGDELVEDVMFGTGVGRSLGAFASDACISAAKETGQAADTIVTENIFQMEQHLWDKSEANAAFYFNNECTRMLRSLNLSIGTGGQFMPLYDGTTNPRNLDGYPAYKTEHCEALGDAGDICLGDFGQYFLMTKGSVATAISIHLRFDYDETAFRSTFRVDGRPAWEQSLRPRKGASTMRVSPFVKLAAR